ncbi:MAG: UDP-3-O-(3-hydroxymyristoyl)glucosamine N-acyltransferase [Rickettsiaceae bacterium]|nr:UDP-3-O-(3-hydroxymyristoyl)glucosamine N-acyltransferase [Rickettsiaceae bacterium]
MSKNFFDNTGPYHLDQIAKFIDAEVIGNPQKEIKDIKALEDASQEDISFLNNKKYIEVFRNSKAGACIVTKDQEVVNSAMTLLKVEHPYFAYAQLLDIFYKPVKKQELQKASLNNIADTAKIADNCYIGHNVVIEDNVEIGENSIIESNSFIGYGVKIGKRARIDANVSITHSIIGDDVVILPGARIGQEGFGFATYKGQHKKVLHIGKVIIGNDVEIGANTCIDRGSMNNTIIEDRCRIDNLVQIAHNVHLKTGTVIVAQVGIAGSTTLGKYCVVGGQVGIAGHLNIADFVNIAAQSGVRANVPVAASLIGGAPAVPIQEWHRQTITLKNLAKRK